MPEPTRANSAFALSALLLLSAPAFWYCTASSSTPDTFVKQGSSFSATAVLHNGTPRSVQVNVTQYKSPACARLLAGDSDALAHLETETQMRWKIEPDQNIPLLEGMHLDDAAPCQLIAVDYILFLVPVNAIARRYVPNYGAPTMGAVLILGDKTDDTTVPSGLEPLKQIELPAK